MLYIIASALGSTQLAFNLDFVYGLFSITVHVLDITPPKLDKLPSPACARDITRPTRALAQKHVGVPGLPIDSHRTTAHLEP